MDLPQSEMTVGELLDRLSACERDAVVRLGINPFFPMAHKIGDVVAGRDENGPVVYIAEAKDAEQVGYLPPEVAVRLAWQGPTEAPARRRPGTGRTSGGR